MYWRSFMALKWITLEKKDPVSRWKSGVQYACRTFWAKKHSLSQGRGLRSIIVHRKGRNIWAEPSKRSKDR